MAPTTYHRADAGEAIRPAERGRWPVPSPAARSGDPTTKPGKANIRTVAAAAGVSTATVSRVMSGVPTVNSDLAERVRRVAEDMAYRPSEAARGLALGAIRNIGALMPDLGNAYFHDVLKSMNDVASPTGYRMLIADHSGDPDSEFATAWDLLGHVDGLALLSSRLDVARLRELARQSTPIVLVNRVACSTPVPSGVGIDSL